MGVIEYYAKKKIGQRMSRRWTCPHCKAQVPGSVDRSHHYRTECREVDRAAQTSGMDRRDLGRTAAIAESNMGGVTLLAATITPLAYIGLGRTGAAILSFLGFILIPIPQIVGAIHCRRTIKKARATVSESGLTLVERGREGTASDVTTPITD